VTIFWLIVAAVMFIGEMVCPIFFMFWFALGAIVSLVVSLITSNIVVQVGIFLGVSIILTIFTRPLTNKFFKNKAKDELNMNGIVGKNAIVTKTINNLNGNGEVKISGETWSALSESEDTIISPGTKVVVIKVDGVKLIVKPAEEN